MESMDARGPAQHRHAVGAVDEAEAAALRWVGGLRLPPLFYTSLGLAVAVQVHTACLGIAAQDSAGLALLGAGLVVFAAVAVLQLVRFRRANGAWVSGLATQVVLGGAGGASTAYVLALGGGLWAGFEGQWWLAIVSAGLGGAGYALSGIRWWRRYQQQPAAHARGESLGWLAAAGALALVGAALLLALG